MTGGEIIAGAAAAGKAIGAVGKQALGEDESTNAALLRIAENTPEMAAAARSKAARVAVKERIRLKLYEPFARMLGVSKAYFEDAFPEEMAAKTASIPDENFVTPPANLAVPALQGLSYTFQDAELKELYLNLLATASDDRYAKLSHPAFAEIIKQLTPKEAKFLLDVLTGTANDTLSIVRIKKVDALDYFIILYTHLMNLLDDDQATIIEESDFPTWVDNWIRLGLITVSYTEFHAGQGVYDWVNSRPEYTRLQDALDDGALKVDQGVLRATNFGSRFFRAVNIDGRG